MRSTAFPNHEPKMSPKPADASPPRIRSLKNWATPGLGLMRLMSQRQMAAWVRP